MIPVLSIWFVTVRVSNAFSLVPRFLLRECWDYQLVPTTHNCISTYPLTDATREVAVSVIITTTLTWAVAGDNVIAGQGHHEWIGGDYSNERHKRSNGEEAHLSNI